MYDLVYIMSIDELWLTVYRKITRYEEEIAMPYQVKKTIAGMAGVLMIMIFYCVFVYQSLQTGADLANDLMFWGKAMLITIGISVAAGIIIQIVFHILLSAGIAVKQKINNGDCDEKEIGKRIHLEMTEDERDKLIELKAMRTGYIFCGIGFVLSLVSLVLKYPAAVMLNILFLSFFTGHLFEGFSQIYYYLNGVKNG